MKKYKVEFVISEEETNVWFHQPTETMRFGKADITEETKSCFLFQEIVAISENPIDEDDTECTRLYFNGHEIIASYPIIENVYSLIPEKKVIKLIEDYNNKKDLFIELSYEDLKNDYCISTPSELGDKITKYTLKYMGTPQYNDIILAIEFGYHLREEELEKQTKIKNHEKQNRFSN